MTGNYRKLHNVTGDQIRDFGSVRPFGIHRRMRNVDRILIGESEGKNFTLIV